MWNKTTREIWKGFKLEQTKLFYDIFPHIVGRKLITLASTERSQLNEYDVTQTWGGHIVRRTDNKRASKVTMATQENFTSMLIGYYGMVVQVPLPPSSPYSMIQPFPSTVSFFLPPLRMDPQSKNVICLYSNQVLRNDGLSAPSPCSLPYSMIQPLPSTVSFLLPPVHTEAQNKN